MIPNPLRVLCLDIEGGFGGSSRSLFYLIRHLNPKFNRVEVWCRSDGPIVARYREIGVPVKVVPDMPKVSSLPRLSRTAWAHLKFTADFIHSRAWRNSLVQEINSRFDVVHFNHEALYILSSWLRRRTSAAFVMHSRTQLWNTWVARMQARRLVKDNDVNVFITERERENVQRLAAWSGGVVIHNVVEVSKVKPQPYESILDDARFRIGCLANYSWLRGIDRLVDVALTLKEIGHEDILFVIAGSMALKGTLPGRLGKIGARGGSLVDYAGACGVDDMFLFLGHVDSPERVLSACHALIKPSREDNPWGRDILEAMSFGLPVFACGTYQKFVKPRVTGYLYPHDDSFEPREVAEDILALRSDPEVRNRMSIAASRTVELECNGTRCAGSLAEAWGQAYLQRTSRQRSS